MINNRLFQFLPVLKIIFLLTILFKFCNSYAASLTTKYNIKKSSSDYTYYPDNYLIAYSTIMKIKTRLYGNSNRQQQLLNFAATYDISNTIVTSNTVSITYPTKVNDNNETTASSLSSASIKNNDINIYDINSTIMVQRIDEKEQMLNMELYHKNWFNKNVILSSLIPNRMKRSFVLAKVGVRTYSSSGEMMDGLIARIFGDRVDMNGDSCHSGIDNSYSDNNDLNSDINDINNIHEYNNDEDDNSNSNNKLSSNNSNSNNKLSSNNSNNNGGDSSWESNGNTRENEITKDDNSVPLSSSLSASSITTTATATAVTPTVTIALTNNVADDQNTGITTTVPSPAMVKTTAPITFDNKNNNNKNNNSNKRVTIKIPSTSSAHFSIGVFVYMWVKPQLRGQYIGDFLLSTAIQYCRNRGDQYMLLVHDDRGTGKLINYYTDRGFVPIFDFIDRGMICKITGN